MKTFELSHQKNIRDLGGLPGFNGKKIKFGRFYRGGSLHNVNEEDISIIKSMNLTDVVDYRGEDEFIDKPDYRIDGINYINLPVIEEKLKPEDIKKEDGNLLWFIEKGAKGFEHLKQQYASMVTSPKSQKAYREFFKLLQEPNRSVYFHCSQGKDRTGLAAFYIETILGVDFSLIKEDYLLSNVAMEEKVDRILLSVKDKPFYDETYHQSLLDVFSAKIEYLNEAIKAMNELYGGPLNYIKNVLNVDIDKFRKMYLE